MKGKEIDLTQHSTGTNNAVTVTEEVVAQNVDKVAGILGLIAGSNDGLDIVTDSLPAVLLKSLDDLGGLYKSQQRFMIIMLVVLTLK